jgi:hypothetical protein
MVQIRSDAADITVTITVPSKGGYSPDVLHDVKSRAVEAFREAFTVRYPDGVQEEIEEEEALPDEELS